MALADLTRLTGRSLWETEVSDAGARQLHEALPNLPRIRGLERAVSSGGR